MNLLSTLTLLTLIIHSVSSLTGPLVTLDYGSLQGNYSGNTTNFLGIPYAAPPYVLPTLLTRTEISTMYNQSLGNLRFAAPQPPLAFSGIRQATSYATACPQEGVTLLTLGIINITYSIDPSTGTSEDCETTMMLCFL